MTDTSRTGTSRTGLDGSQAPAAGPVAPAEQGLDQRSEPQQAQARRASASATQDPSASARQASVGKNLVHGSVLGSILLAPGLSVATVAIVLGIYESLLATVKDAMSSRWRSTLRTIIPLGLAALVAVALASRVLSWADDRYPYQMMFLFVGLVLGAIPMTMALMRASSAPSAGSLDAGSLDGSQARSLDGKASSLDGAQASARPTPAWLHWLLGLVAAFGVATLGLLQRGTEDVVDAVEAYQGLTFVTAMALLLAGALAAVSMLLPGLSAALMLLVLGVYQTLLQAVSDVNLAVLGLVAVGAVLGMAAAGHGISYLLKYYPTATYSAILGMIVGSVAAIFPGIPSGAVTIATSIVSLLVGLGAVLLVERSQSGPRR